MGRFCAIMTNMAKYSKKFNRDWEFYLRHRNKFTYAGSPINVEYDVDGVDAKRAFWTLDSQGKLIPTHEAELLHDILITKAAINFHLKMWAEGYDDMFMGVQDYMAEFDNPPEWVEKSFRTLKTKFYFTKIQGMV